MIYAYHRSYAHKSPAVFTLQVQNGRCLGSRGKDRKIQLTQNTFDKGTIGASNWAQPYLSYATQLWIISTRILIHNFMCVYISSEYLSFTSCKMISAALSAIA